MPPVSSLQTLIVGAGPTGLTAAVELARRDLPVTIVDRRPDASGLSRAVGITPASLRLLRESGVTDRLLAEGQHVRSMVIYFRTRKSLELSLRGFDPEFDFILALAQDRTESILRERLQANGVSVEYDRELTGLEPQAETVSVKS